MLINLKVKASVYNGYKGLKLIAFASRSFNKIARKYDVVFKN